jgi:hypothetical protein
MIYKLKTTIEHLDTIQVRRATCFGAEALQEERAHQRAMAPTGSTVTFTQE